MSNRKKYWIDSACVDCDLCGSIAPQLFKRDPAAGIYVVTKQPSTDGELSKYKRAAIMCPVDAIHPK